MIRWNFVLPRLIGLAVVLLLLHFGAGAFLRLSAVSALRAISGRRVELGKVTASVWSGKATFRNLHLSPVEGESFSPLEAEELTFDLSMQDALKKTLVLEEASLRGLRVDLDRIDDLIARSKSDGSASAGLDWQPYLDQTGDWLAGGAKDLADDIEGKLQSPRLARELAEKWPTEWRQLHAEADELVAQAKQIKQLVAAVKQNPVRAALEIENGLRLGLDIQERGLAIKDRVAGLVQSAQTDRQAILQAKQADVDFLKANYGSWQAVDKRQLSAYLIGDSMSGYVAQGLQCVKYVRAILPYLKNPVQPPRLADRFIAFRKTPVSPTAHLKTLLLEGVCLSGTREIPLSGMVQDLSTQPQFVGRPTQLRLVSSDHQFPGELVAELDYTSATPSESFSLRLPKLALPAVVLGKPDRLAMRLAEGTAQLEARFRFVDDRVAGQIELERSAVAIEPTVASKWGGERLAQSLRTALNTQAPITLSSRLEGEINRPRMEVETNLADGLEAGVKQVAQAEFEQAKQAAYAKLNAELEGQLQRLDGLIAEQEQKLQEKLGLSGEEVRQLRQLAESQLGGRLGALSGQVAGKLQGKVPNKVQSALRALAPPPGGEGNPNQGETSGTVQGAARNVLNGMFR